MTSTISGVKELRYKESDRIATMTEGLRHLGSRSKNGKTA